MSNLMKTLLDVNEKYREYLYPKGFLITTCDVFNIHEYPFYGNWNMTKIDKYYFYIQKRNRLFTYSSGGITFFMIGHAYNPFSNYFKEDEILKELADSYSASTLFADGGYFDVLSKITGIFITGYIVNSELFYCGDATCTQVSFYGVVNNNFYISSHTMLFEDLIGVRKSDYITRLINYRHYKLFGIMLPGALSPYNEFKRMVPNYQLKYSSSGFELARFWPRKKIDISNDYNYIIKKAADILHNNLFLISKKYPNRTAAISMTGGCDSKTTMACANGLYDCFQYFSFASTDDEQIDLEAAGKIAKSIGVEHKKYYISSNDEDYPDIEIWKQLIDWNTGNIGHKHFNDYCKRVYFVEHHDFDIEIKSWASEIVRAYYNKRFAMSTFPSKVTPRYLTSMYKVFTYQRKLMRETDKVFADYLKQYYSDSSFEYVNWTDLIFWEYRYAAWNGLSTSHEHVLSYDITIPYNNRKLLELLLKTPLDYRILDRCHKDIQRLRNPLISDSEINVINIKHTSKRAKMERAYLALNTKLPF